MILGLKTSISSVWVGMAVEKPEKCNKISIYSYNLCPICTVYMIYGMFFIFIFKI